MLVFCVPLLAADSLLVLNKDDAAMVVMDPATGKITGRVLVGEGPHELVTDGAGKLAFASNYGTGPNPGNTISVIDLVTVRELRRIDVSPLKRPHGLYFSGGKLYFSAEANKAFGRYDPVADRIDWIVGTGQETTHMVMVSKDQKQIYTANISGNSISIFDLDPKRGWLQTVVPVGRGPEAIDLSPDGTQLWTAHSQDGGVSIIDLASRKVTGTFSAGTKRSNRLKFTPDGKRILISDLAAGELLVFDVASRQEIKRLALGKSPEGILITPDGSRAYVAVNGDNFVAVVDLATLHVTGRLEPGGGPDGMAWVAGH
jgi:YVTN family beta-propeller protein